MSGSPDSAESSVPLSSDNYSLQPPAQRSLLGEITLADVRRFVLFLPVYWIAYRYALLFTQNAASPFWSPDAVLLCWLLASPRKQWWAYLVVSLQIRLMLSATLESPLWFQLATYANDAVKGLLSAYVLRRLLGFPVRLGTLRAFTIFVATAAIAVPFLSALAGAAARHALGHDYWPAWYEWFLGDVLASLIITPALLYWFVGRQQVNRRPTELALLCLGLTAMLYYAFVLPNHLPSHLLLCIPFPFLIWAVARTGPLGTSAALSLLSLFSIVSAARGNGVFSSGTPSENALAIQFFLLVVSVPLLFLAVAMEERRAIQDDLRHSRQTVSENYERIRDLAGRLIHTQEEERRRIARELHDDIGQNLALLQARLTGLSHQLPDGMESEHALVNEVITDINEVSVGIRDLSRELHSNTLQLLGLRPALNKLCREASEKYSITAKVDGTDDPELSHDARLCLYRVAQEAVSNAVRHGKAQRISIELHSDHGLVRMCVRDWGIGFDTAVSSKGLGLVSMHERVRMLGGEVDVKSRPEAGTEIIVRLPVPGYEIPKLAS
jgi:two-component system sensor histidine kinase UhpB